VREGFLSLYALQVRFRKE